MGVHTTIYRIPPRPIGNFTFEPTGVRDPFPGCAGWSGASPQANWLCAELSGNGVINMYDGHYTAWTRGSPTSEPCGNVIDLCGSYRVIQTPTGPIRAYH